MSEILDRGSLLFASLAVAAFTVMLHLPIPFYLPLLVLAVFYVPGLILLGGLFGAGTMFQRDYAPLLACTGTAWCVSSVPLLAVRWAAPGYLPAGIVLMFAYFAVLTFFAVRTVFGIGNGPSAGIAAFSWVPLVAANLLWGPLRFVMGWLASPFFLFFAWYYLGGELGNLGAGLRSRQNFRRMLDAAALNPHDAEAQYQLGLIYQQRRQYSEAQRRFENAITIDPRETDAHFQLGGIARGQGRLNDALAEFQTVLDQDPDHHQNEILREIGAVYLDAGKYEYAWNELAAYAEKRPYDPEGLYYCARALDALGKNGEAKLMYARAVDAVQSAPRYRRRVLAKWSRLAQKRLRAI